MNRTVLFVALVTVAAAVPAAAQGRGQSQGRSQGQQGRTQVENRAPVEDRTGTSSRGREMGRGPLAVPPGHWPSAGRCRIWIDGVPAGRQSRETDCATARRNVPQNGRVLDGSRRSDDDRDGWDDRYDRDNDRDDDRTTRRFIDRNGLICEEKAVTKNGRRSYDLKCREPKGNDRRDRNGDWSNWPVGGQDDDRYCVDTNRDGRCDAGAERGYPATLPEMIGAIVYGQGQRSDDVARWLGAGHYRVRYTDQNRDRKPEAVRWLNSAGIVLQEWTDRNRDGRADVVHIYNAGRLVQSIGGR